MPQSEWEPSDDVISAANKAWWGERGGSDVERMRAALKAVREDMVREEREECANLVLTRYWEPRCTHGHDRCYYGADEDCPLCERVSPAADAIRARSS